jgi:hypothetical protein
MGRLVFRASLPWLTAAVVVGLHFEPKLAPATPDPTIMIEEQAPPPRRAPKPEPEARLAPPLPV